MLEKFLQCVLILCCFGSKGVGQINCDFTYTDVTGCGGFAVEFCDASSSTAGNIVAWSWNMEVSAFSVECPSTVFSQPGVYTVCLTVTDSQGNTCTECKADLVNVYALPTPNFVADITQGCTPLEVTFTDLSQSIDGNIVQWVYGVGGSCGTVQSNGVNPVATCTYTIPGSYNVSLIVADDNGCINTTNKVSYINVSPQPVINIAATDPFGCNAPHDITFVNNGNISNITYNWDFGNNDSYTGPTPPPITYDAPGAYTVTVIATDQTSGCTDTLVLEEYINIGYPASFSYSPSDGCEDLTVSFTDNSTYVAQSINWDFGDGTTSTLANPVHVFTEPGCYTVVLSRMVDGCLSLVYIDNCINVDPEPDVWYTNDNLIGCTLPHVVNFSGASMLADEWFWDFGDGTTSTAQNPTHSYTSFGIFPVSLTVTDAVGCSNDTIMSIINVIELEGMTLDDFYDGCIPLTVSIMDNTVTVSPITSWSWEATSGTNVYTSNEQHPTFTIVDTGVYDVVLITFNTLGCVDTAYFQGMIEAGDYPEVNFEATPLETCIDAPVLFTDLTPGDVDTWLWNFGDGGTATVQNPEYFYSDTGYYDVSLIVENNGCFTTIMFDDYIHAIAPLARFEVINFCDNKLLRQFVNTSIGADSTYWDFGVPGTNTDTSTLTNPEFMFPSTGTYTVTQWVYSFVTGCAHSTTLDVIVTTPQAIFSITPLEGCAALTVSVVDASIDASTWLWTSVNGNISNTTATNPTITYPQPGLYMNDITLIVTDINECQDTLTLSDPIYVNAVNANFTSDVTTGCAPLTVSFEDLSVNNYFADVVGWNWNFGPGLGSSSLQNPEFTFQNLGTYDVTLVVTDSWGCTNTLTLVDYIDATFPVAGFTADTLSCTDNNMPFQSTSSGWQLSYNWDFGDGATGTGANPLHQYAIEGTYMACLTITDGYGCTDFFCDDIVVADPVAAFTVDSTFASCPPLPVNFTNFSTNASSYLWDFGDGNAPSDFENPTYVYVNPGTFDVTLIAIRTEACKDTLIFTDLIVLDGPVGEYTVSIDTSCAPAEVTFIANAIEPYTFIWDFGEGTIDSSDMPIIYDSVVYTYLQSGTFTPTLSLLNNTGCFRTLPIVSTVYVAGLDVDFEASKRAVCGDDPAIAFTPSFNATEAITSVEWFFENGNPPTSTSMNPFANFTVPGLHDVMLITHSTLCVDTLLKEDFIGVGETPIADFIMSESEGCAPLSIAFTDMSYVPNGFIAEWNWDFGDGSTSNSQNPVHVFEPSAGIFVNLEVATDVGCTDTYFDNAIIHALTELDAGPDATVCIGEAVQLQGTIGTDPAQVDFYWTPATGLSCTDCLDPWVLNPTDTITYTFVVINAEDCASQDEVTIWVRPYPVPAIVIPPDTTLCANDLLQIIVGVANNVTVFTYQWDTSTPGLSCYNDCFNPVALPEVTSTYVVTVTSTDNCVSVDSITIEIENQFQPFTGPDRTICEGDSITLDASLGADPQWQGDGLSCAYCPNPVSSPDSTTTYVVQVTTAMGCLVIDTITINVLHLEEVGAGEDFAVCLGEVAYLQGYGPGQITWSPEATLNDATILTPEGLPTEDIVYTMTAVNGECSYADSVLVEVNLKTELLTTDLQICEGDEVALSVEGFADSYQWSPEDCVSNPAIENPLVNPIITTTYTVVGALGLCEADTATLVVEVIPAPLFYLPSVINFLEGQTIPLQPSLLEEGDFSYEWSPATGLFCTTCDSTYVIEITEDVTYTLAVTDENTGCIWSSSVRMEKLMDCSEDLIYVPNAFSPNDDGINDELQLFLSPVITDVKLFSIYNRWGAQVFSADNHFTTWDGTIRGDDLQEGVYVYFVEFICPLTGNKLLKKGDITLMK